MEHVIARFWVAAVLQWHCSYIRLICNLCFLLLLSHRLVMHPAQEGTIQVAQKMEYPRRHQQPTQAGI